MKIWNYEVGPGHPCFVVAEFGSNHGGSFDAALALIDAAAEAGANAVKGQFWLSADEMYDRAQFPDEWASADRYRLPAKWLPALRDRAHERGLAFGLSSFGFASLDMADQYVDFHKVASIESGWPEFVAAVLFKYKPTLVSTGMHEHRLDNTLHPNMPIFLGCTVAYPCEISDANVREAVRSGWWDAKGQLWGYSDHTLHPTIAPCAAVALGACVVEKHIRHCSDLGHTYDEPLEDTPDSPHSLEPEEFAEMVQAIRLTEQALGSSEKRIRESERPYLKYRRGPRGLRGA